MLQAISQSQSLACFLFSGGGGYLYSPPVNASCSVTCRPVQTERICHVVSTPVSWPHLPTQSFSVLVLSYLSDSFKLKTEAISSKLNRPPPWGSRRISFLTATALPKSLPSTHSWNLTPDPLQLVFLFALPLSNEPTQFWNGWPLRNNNRYSKKWAVSTGLSKAESIS